MFAGFIRNFVPHHGNPIGIDLGGRTLRLAQVEPDGDQLKLIHADAIDVPADAAKSIDAYSSFFVDSVRASLRRSPFRGRKVALALPASAVQVKHIRTDRRAEGPDADAALVEQVAAALNVDGAAYTIRNVIAGDIAGETNPQQEVVAFATPRDLVQRILDDATAARVDIVGVHVQPRVLVDAFGHFHRRKVDAEAVNLFVDLGDAGTRAVVADPIHIRFVRTSASGIAAMHASIAAAMRMHVPDVAVLRRKVIAAQTGRSHELSATPQTPGADELRLIAATEIQARLLADELEMCRRYYEATFPERPIGRLIFVGGGAKDRLLCAAVAQAMSLPAQIGDPLVRFNRSALPNLQCLDRREPQPEWSAAIGLSLCGQTVTVV